MAETFDVKCPGCDGKGRRPLARPLAFVYYSLTDCGPQTPAGMARRYGNNPGRQAFANRLARLERIGLATSQATGRSRTYTAVKV